MNEIALPWKNNYLKHISNEKHKFIYLKHISIYLFIYVHEQKL
jgi:hypothetical protein